MGVRGGGENKKKNSGYGYVYVYGYGYGYVDGLGKLVRSGHSAVELFGDVGEAVVV